MWHDDVTIKIARDLSLVRQIRTLGKPLRGLCGEGVLLQKPTPFSAHTKSHECYYISAATFMLKLFVYSFCKNTVHWLLDLHFEPFWYTSPATSIFSPTSLKNIITIKYLHLYEFFYKYMSYTLQGCYFILITSETGK